MKKKAAILGSTGSVGIQAIEAARQLEMDIVAVCAGKNAGLLAEQSRELGCRYCAIGDESAAELRGLLDGTSVRVLSGAEAVPELITECGADIFINAISGAAGLAPSAAVIKSGKTLALANKETLVIGGEVLMPLAAETGAEIIPVDSELCAIHQCLRSGNRAELSRILLTASGGPFFGYSSERLKSVTLAETLSHPTWKMGAKITVDSATLLNKGFEVIETSRLFAVDPARIEVIIHRESIIHSMVEYIDNSVIAQLGVPDMRSCVQYALTLPARTAGISDRLDFTALGSLSFFAPDYSAFPLLGAAYDAARAGGAVPAVLNGASEAAVGLFLDGKIEFYRIADVIMETIERMDGAAAARGLDEILDFDDEARRRVYSNFKS